MQIRQQRRPLKFLNATKMRAKQTQGQKTKAQAIILWSIKIPINSTLFDAQNAGNRISELLDFFFLGACPQTPLGVRGLAAPLVATAGYYTFSGRL